MSDFTEYVQTELPFRASIDVIATTGSLLVKVNNSFSRDYQALSQGILNQVLVSAGANSAPGWTQSLVLLSLEIDNITINDNKITSSTGTIDFDNEDLTTTGIINCSHIKALATEGLILEPTLGKAIQATADGDARGIYAIDFQTYRDNVNQVASGDYSIICGGTRNKATGNQSFIGSGNANISLSSTGIILGGGNNSLSVAATSSAIMSGTNNEITNYNSVIVGGRNNTISGHDSFIDGGLRNSISEMYSIINCGADNTITAQYAFIGSGANNTASGYMSVICGGVNCTTETAAHYSAVINGNHATTKKKYGLAIGLDTISKNYGEFAQSSGKFNTYGDAQTSLLLARRTTTTASNTTLKLDGNSEVIALDTNRTYVFCIHVAAHNDIGSQSAAYRIEGCIFCKGTTYTLKNTTTTIIYEDNAAWNAFTWVGGTPTALHVYVTGAAATTINWVARIELTQVGK